MNNIEEILLQQKNVCQHYKVNFCPIKTNQLVVISEGVYEGLPIEGIRYPSPEHMSGWWLITDQYDDNIQSLKTVHFQHILDTRLDIVNYMALPFGFRFTVGYQDDIVEYDINVANESFD